MPWDAKNDGNQVLIAKYQDLERTSTNLLVANAASFSRPWWADDRAQVQLANITLSHALIKGTNGLGGPLRTFITDVFTAAVDPKR